MNNELVRLQDEEAAEIARILAELTEVIQANTNQIEFARSISAYFELLFAKGRFGRDFDCVSPTFSKGLLLSLIKARHPLLEDNLRREKGSISPVSLDMDSNRRILVISGPNAGGKTVVLKTVGLFALMAQSGIPLPAEDATLPILDRVLADIGDQQSITNHLSTFSAHVLAIKSMIEAATARSLILLDEIGSSTEPGEGAALGRAVLEEFREIGALTIATTHYNRLKMYAETTTNVANAAMEFNEITLQPTYRLIHGLAGASSGLKIAERLQLPSRVLLSAINYLDASDVEAGRYVEELKQRIVDLQQEKAHLEKQRQEFEEWKRKEVDHLNTEHKLEIERVERKLEHIVRQVSERASRELQSAGEESLKKFQKKLEAARADAAREINREKEKSGTATEQQSVPRAAQPSFHLEEGQKVRISSMGVNGTIASIKDGKAEVLMGSIKLRRPLEDLEVIEQSPIKLPRGVQVSVVPKQLDTNEINLIGRKADEAVEMADKFLDDAFLAQLTQVRIVHGMGTGTLRQAIADLLSKHPHVSGFEPAPYSEGGRGVTVVTLRE
jgi:DNA mismatch repair protein MutS2